MARCPKPPAAFGRMAAVLLVALVLAACGSMPASDVPDGGAAGDATLDDTSGDDREVVPPPDSGDTNEYDTLGDDAADTIEPDTAVDAGDAAADTAEPDAWVDAPDTDASAADASDTGWGDPCEPPIRMRPTSGSTAGGTVVEVAGYEWYIGALGWWLRLEDHVLGETWGSRFAAPCTTVFVTRPASPGPRDAYIYYGGPEGGGREDLNFHAGTFTFVDEPGPAPGAECDDLADCDPGVETCHVGIGACVTNRCASASCGSGWIGGACHELRGCVDPGECESDDDCRLLYSPCSCVAVPTTDPRSSLDPCLYDGCVECDGNRCAISDVEAACQDGVCVEVAR